MIREEAEEEAFLPIPRILLRRIGELPEIVNREFVVRSCLLLGFLEEGSLSINIPEVGKQEVSKNEWFLLADKGVPSETKIAPKSDGLLLIAPLRAISQDRKCHENSFRKLDCVSCCDRRVSFFTTGKCIGRIRELARIIQGTSPGKISDNLLNLSRCFELIARILEQPEMDRSASCRRVISGEDVSCVKAAAKYLDQHLAEDHRLNDICRYCYINEFKLKKGFRECFGTTVFGYLRLKRMEKAKAMIENGADSVIEIANTVGYTNASHFARAFRQVYGINPGTLITEQNKLIEPAFLN